MQCSDENKPCDFCEHGWIVPVLQRVPKPYPNYDRLPDFHYLAEEETQQ